MFQPHTVNPQKLHSASICHLNAFKFTVIPLLLILFVLIACSGTPTDAAEEFPPDLVERLYDNYSSDAPHFTHIRTAIADFRISYLGAAQREAELTWLIDHYDMVLSGMQAEIKKRRPGIKVLPYVLLLSVIQPGQITDNLATAFYSDMQNWYEVRPECSLETAFLHDSAGNRMEVMIWNTDRWMTNPGDACARRYHAERMYRLASGTSEYDADGVFVDEFAQVGESLNSEEYTTRESLDADIDLLLLEVREELNDAIIQLNTAEYMTPSNRKYLIRAGHANLEYIINVNRTMEDRWNFIDGLLDENVEVQAITRWNNQGYNNISGFVGGTQNSTSDRARIFELANYYMVVTPPPIRVLFTPYIDAWRDEPFSDYWVKAFEANIGEPLEPRSVYVSGVDPAGQGYRVIQRPFERAMVLVRPKIVWNQENYSDASAVEVPLPENEDWHLLYANGSLGEAISSVDLRMGEGAVLIRRSALE